MKQQKSRFEITFNEWAKEYKVSTMWDNTKPENRRFIERLNNAREYHHLLTHKGQYMAKNPNRVMYHKQMIEMAKDSKEILTVRKEIIIDETVTNEKLGEIIRQMYKAKCQSADEHIAHLNLYLNED